MEKRLQQALKSGNDTDRQHDNSLLRSILSHMKVEQGLTLQQLINTYAEISPDESVPVSIFAQSLSPSEALCTYLHRQRGLSFHEIALLINRDERSVWTSCSRAGAKRGTLIQPDKDSIRIPTSLFHDRSLSILEHVVYHLKSAHSMTNAKVAALLNKNPSAVATVAKRAERKRADIKMQEKAGAKNPPERKGGAGR